MPAAATVTTHQQDVADGLDRRDAGNAYQVESEVTDLIHRSTRMPPESVAWRLAAPACPQARTWISGCWWVATRWTRWTGFAEPLPGTYCFLP